MGKKPDKEKNTKPKETEEDKLLQQLKKPMKKLVKRQGPEKTREAVQHLITSIETSLEVKAAKDKIEKEAKAAKKAIDREAKEALAALSQPSPAAPATKIEQQGEPHQTPAVASPEVNESAPVDGSTANPDVPQAAEGSSVPSQRRGNKAKVSNPQPSDQSQG